MSSNDNVNFSGLATGIDVKSVVKALIDIDSEKLIFMKKRVENTNAAISNISTLANSFKRLASAMIKPETGTSQEDFSKYSSDPAIQVTKVKLNGAGLVKHDLEVVQMAKSDKINSKSLSSKTKALGLADNFVISSGEANNVSVELSEDDSINTIADKINSIKAGVRASVIGDERNGYHLNISGDMTGEANKITLSGAADSSLLDMNGLGRKYQTAQDAIIKLDGIEIKSQTNKIAAVDDVEFQINRMPEKKQIEISTIDTSNDEIVLKIKEFVNAFNETVSAISISTISNNTEISHDSFSRQLGNIMRQKVGASYGSSKFNVLRDVGVSLDKTGKLSLDEQKLTLSLETNKPDVEELLYGQDGKSGMFGTFRKTIDSMLKTSTGAFDMKIKSLTYRVENLSTSIDSEQARLDTKEFNLKQQFSKLDQDYSANMSTLNYLNSLSK